MWCRARFSPIMNDVKNFLTKVDRSLVFATDSDSL